VPLKAQWIQRSAARRSAPDELVVVCLVRNGEPRITDFLDYYLELGAQHIVLVDNASTDRTLETACRSADRVSVLSCTLDYRLYQIPIKMWLTSRFAGQGWCLVADIDEYFDYPESGRLGLASFLEYLNDYQYSGVVCQSVDLFSQEPPAEWPERGDELRSRCVWYDHSLLKRPDHLRSFSMNRVSNPAITPMTGGIKQVAFGVDRLLTKHVLIRRCRGARLNGPHHSRGARIADVSAALLHYPFDRGFRARCQEAVREGKYWENSREFRRALDVLETAGSLWTLRRPTARVLKSVDQLVDEGFLVASEPYRQYARQRSRPR
jgi:hypothetical protein